MLVQQLEMALEFDRWFPTEDRGLRCLFLEALTGFIIGLPSGRQLEALDTLVDSSEAPIDQRLGALCRLSPVLHKVGQTLARDLRLPEELRLELSALESLSPEVTSAAVLPVLAEHGLHPVEEPLAQGSLAVVVPCREGLAKVLIPGIRERLQEDLDSLAEVVKRLDQCRGGFKIHEILVEVGQRLMLESDLRREAENMVRAREFYTDRAHNPVPRLLRSCGPEVLVMERVKAIPLPQAVGQVGSRVAGRLARRLIDLTLSDPLFRRGPVHTDLHGGNLMLTDQDRLVVIDWSSVVNGAELAPAVLKLGAALALGNRERLVEMLCAYGGERTVVEQVVEANLDGDLGRVLDRLALETRLDMPLDLLFLRRTIHALEGVVRHLDPQLSIWTELSTSAVLSLAGELPWRCLIGRGSAFSSGLSNGEFLQLL